MIRPSLPTMPEPGPKLDYAAPEVQPAATAPPWLPWALFFFGCVSCLLNRLMIRTVGYAHDHGPLLDTFPVLFFGAGAAVAWNVRPPRTAFLVLLNCAGVGAALLLAYMDVPKS